ncbi:MAG: 30S ribosomal protein S2 [Candidatus Margulisiibacteriota bacterium]
MPVVTMKELLEAGVHFGHQSKRWNPKMKKYIYSSRNDIHVIDLHKTIPLIEKAYEFVRNTAAQNGTVLFVGTKKQAQEAIEESAKHCGMFFVNQRWMGGTLTNFKTLKKNIARLNEIETWKEDGTFEKLPKKEVIMIEREHRKLVRGLGGIRQMTGLPALVYIVDTMKEQTAVNEARKLEIPVVAIVDTNTDPDEVDYPIPGNDDAIRAIKLITGVIAEAIIAGREMVKPVEERAEEIAVPLEVAQEEAKALTEEQRIEEQGLAKVKEEPGEEKRTGF